MSDRDKIVDVFVLMQEWIDNARVYDAQFYNVACLSTCDEENRPSSRMVLIKEISSDSLFFSSNIHSPKSKHIALNCYTSLCFFWSYLNRQISCRGVAKVASDAISDRLFAKRTLLNQVVSCCSRQSCDLDSYGSFVSQVYKKYAGYKKNNTVPRRKSQWSSFIFQPYYIEFWEGNEGHLNKRSVYKKGQCGNWVYTGLVYP